jgi:serine/threonine protein phosphatase PrpC
MGVCLAKTKHLTVIDEDVFIDVYENRTPTDAILKAMMSPSLDEVPTPQKAQVNGKTTRAVQYGFEDKLMRYIGDFDYTSLLTPFEVGFICKKGLKPDTANLDDFFITVDDDFFLVGVFDGHGPCGQDVACTAQNFLSSSMVAEQIRQAPESGFVQCFLDCQRFLEHTYTADRRQLDCSISGTTATLVMLMRQRILLAYVGDSRAILVHDGCSAKPCIESSRHQGTDSPDVYQRLPNTPRSPWMSDPILKSQSLGHNLVRSASTALTPPHIPSLPGELDRIEAFNGEIRRLPDEKFDRVFSKGTDYPGISLTRTLGNRLAQNCGVTCTPSVVIRDIYDNDTCLLVCSDGIWEVLSEDEAAAIINKHSDPQVAAKMLATAAWKKWMDKEQGYSDDMTVVVVRLDRFKASGK